MNPHLKSLPIRLLIVFLIVFLSILFLSHAAYTEEKAGNMPSSTQPPWKSIFIYKGMAPSGITVHGEVIEVFIDLGRELSSNEIESLKSKIKLIDKDNIEYLPFGHSWGTKYDKWILDEKTGKKISWHADFEISFKFLVQSRSSGYILYWDNYLPVEIGNPFETPFIK